MELSKALDAIERQTDKNCNLVFVFNGCGVSEKDIFKKFKFQGFNQIDYVLLSENLGDVYAFNYIAKNNLDTQYYYYFDSNVILMPDFVATLNKFVSEHADADIVSFFGVPNIYFKQEYIPIKSLSDDFCHRPLVFFDNKLINIDYIKKNNIQEQKFKNYPLLFYVMIAKYNPKWYSLGRQICSGSQKPTYSYNVMDLFDQCQEIVNMLDQKWFKDHYSEIEYLCIVTLFRNFTYAMFKKNKTNFLLQKKVLNKIEDFVDRNFPTWEKNKWLYSKDNKNDETYLEYLREFKPKLIHVLRALYNKLFVQGHAKQK
ncbi:MAG: glycosyltransferase family 2 protein [Mycoplasma sp.]|nr:glycosyltransferase family 2 protein [Candidatus Hennigella equi]